MKSQFRLNNYNRGRMSSQIGFVDERSLKSLITRFEVRIGFLTKWFENRACRHSPSREQKAFQIWVVRDLLSLTNYAILTQSFRSSLFPFSYPTFCSSISVQCAISRFFFGFRSRPLCEENESLSPQEMTSSRTFGVVREPRRKSSTGHFLTSDVESV